MKSIDQLVGKGLSIWIIGQLIVLNLAWMLTLAVPMSVLVSTLMAFGSMASANEITIFKASGISLPKMMTPVIGLSLIITYLMILFNNDVLPEANHKARVLLSDISRTKPTFFLEAGKFSDDINGVRIYVEKTFENSNKLKGIFIYDYSSPDVRNLITSEEGDIGFTSDFKSIVMNLINGEIHQLNNKNYLEKYRKVIFKNHRIILPASGFGFQSSSDNVFIRGDRELSANDMRRIVDSIYQDISTVNKNFINSIKHEFEFYEKLKFVDTSFSKSLLGANISPQASAGVIYPDTLINRYRKTLGYLEQLNNQMKITSELERQADSYLVEIYKKYSIPFACIVFTLIGAPLGYRVKRGGFGVAAGLSLLFFLLYWASLIGGEKLADRDIISPFLGMWLVNIILGVFGLYLMFKSS
jgi:lipopolysaccharide export system permease protein